METLSITRCSVCRWRCVWKPRHGRQRLSDEIQQQPIFPSDSVSHKPRYQRWSGVHCMWSQQLKSFILIIVDMIYFHFSWHASYFQHSFYEIFHVCLCHSCQVFIIVTEGCWSDCYGWPAPVNRRGNVAASAGLAEGMWTHWQRLEESHIDAIFSSSTVCVCGWYVVYWFMLDLYLSLLYFSTSAVQY